MNNEQDPTENIHSKKPNHFFLFSWISFSVRGVPAVSRPHLSRFPPRQYRQAPPAPG